MGMTAWLYDEVGWLSGGTCGKVLMVGADLCLYIRNHRVEKEKYNEDLIHR